MAYRVEIAPKAARAIKKLEGTAQRRIADAIDGLAERPRPEGVVKLSGEQDHWRIRVGQYRMVYAIYDERLVVLVLNVGHRRNVYRESGK